jgi:A/G-specific adenine glycosylase
MENDFLKTQLLNFYDNSKRVLPWRENKNPYLIWISEIMLQQTRVEAVIPFFNRFISELPTVFDLATIEEDKLLKLWEGLGYYSRARNLKKAAQVIVEKYNEVIPNSKTELESLPGIGPYTSGAILSIAYEQQTPAVDGNVLRVFSRFYQIEEDIKDPKTKLKIKNLVKQSLPQKRNGDYNQAIMELGATICLPNGTPKCHECPLNSHCVSYLNNMQNIIPFRSKKKPRRKQEVTVFIYRYNNLYGLRQRPDTGLLASMYEFPNVEVKLNINDLKKEYPNIIKLSSSKHIFTHIEWYMQGYLIDLDKPLEDLLFVSKEQIKEEYSIPTAFKKYKELILKED